MDKDKIIEVLTDKIRSLELEITMLKTSNYNILPDRHQIRLPIDYYNSTPRIEPTIYC